jgi:hypothetical protein
MALDPGASAMAHRPEGQAGADDGADLGEEQALPEAEGEAAEDIENQPRRADGDQADDQQDINDFGPQVVAGKEGAQPVDVAHEGADRREVEQDEGRRRDGEQDQQAAQLLVEAGRHRFEFDVVLGAFRDVLPGTAHLPGPCSAPPSTRSAGTARAANQRTPKQSRMPRQRRLCTPYFDTPRRRGRWFTGRSATL